MNENKPLLSYCMFGIITACITILVLACKLICQVNLQQGLRQLTYIPFGLIVLLTVIMIGYKNIVKYGYYIALISFIIGITNYLQIKSGNISTFITINFCKNLFTIHGPTIFSIGMSIGIVKLYSEEFNSLFLKKNSSFISKCAFFILLPILFFLSIHKGNFLALFSALIIILIVNKIFNRIAFSLGCAFIAGLIYYGLMQRPIRIFFVAEQAKKMVTSGSLTGTADSTTLPLLKYMPFSLENFFYVTNTYVNGLYWTISIITIWVIFLFLSYLVACKIESKMGKNLLIYVFSFIFFQSIFSFLTSHQIIRGSFFANAPFASYGLYNILGNFILLGLICSVIIESLTASQSKELKLDDSK